LSFAGNELDWVRAYVRSWNVATTNGFADSDLWAIGSGEGLEEFNTVIEAEELENSCTADLNICWEGSVSNLWPCIMEYWRASIYCWTDGNNGAPIEETS